MMSSLPDFSQDTFLLAKSWVEELQLLASSDIIMALSGCKTDLEKNRKVMSEVR